MNTEELLKLCDGDVKLLEIVRILDKHDLGGTASNEPGEYIDEARELIAKSEKITTSSELKALLRDIHKKNFDGKFILPMRYSAVSKELTPVLLKNNL